MPTPEEQNDQAEPRVPVGGLQIAGLILVTLALLAVYNNVQNIRRAHIETVTVAPIAATPTPVPAAPAP